MNERVKKLTEAIRKLSPAEQAELLAILLDLNSGEPDPEIEKAWAEEAGRRIDAVERGEAKTVDARRALRKYK
jgi:Putative addiction module component